MARAYDELCGIVGQEGTRLTADPRPILILRYKHVFVGWSGMDDKILYLYRGERGS